MTIVFLDNSIVVLFITVLYTNHSVIPLVFTSSSMIIPPFAPLYSYSDWSRNDMERSTGTAVHLWNCKI